MPKVSVIVPVYNAENFLSDSVERILSQTLTDIEVIFVDDGSTDGSLKILKEIRDERVKVLTQKNINAGAARNRGLEIATGEYLSFLDADDLFEPDMLLKAYQKAEETKAQIVLFGADNYVQGEDRYEPIDSNITDDENIFLRMKGWTWDKLFRAGFINENGIVFQEQRTSNDLLFVYSALVKAESVEVLDETLIHRRVNNAESISSTREKSWHCCFTALYALRAQLIKWDLYDKYEQDFVNYVLELALWNVYTLKQPSKDMFIYMCVNEWFKELDITKHDESYFRDKEKYNWYKEIMTSHFDNETFKTDGIVSLIYENENLTAQVNSKAHKLGEALVSPVRKIKNGGRNE